MIVAGVMSGTSADGIDVAYLRILGRGLRVRWQLLGHAHTAYPPAVRRAVLADRARRVLTYKRNVRAWLKQAPPPSGKRVAQLRERMKRFEDAVHRQLAF